MPYLSKAGALKTIDDTWEANSILFLKCYLGITVSVPPVVSNTTKRTSSILKVQSLVY